MSRPADGLARLCRQYLAETGLTAAAAVEAMEWEVSGPTFNADTLGADYERWQQLDARSLALWEFARSLAQPGEVDEHGAALAQAERQAIRALYAATDPDDARRHGHLHGALWWLADYPGWRAVSEALAALSRQAQARKSEIRNAKIRALLTTAEGRRLPDPWAWLEPRLPDDAERRSEAWFTARAAFAEIRAEEAEQRAEVAERKLEEARRPSLRQGTAALRTMLRTEEHVADARRRGQVAARLTPEQVEARKLFRYEPLGWAERLVTHGLASLAREQGLLDSHPWALSRKPIVGQPAPRVKLPFPGISELARVLGYTAEADGKIDRATRKTIEGALRDLCLKARWIATPVLLKVPKKGGKKGETEWAEDVEVTQTLWVEASHTLITKGVYLNLHPAAIASHLESFLSVPDLAARYEAAKLALGKRQMRDEWAIADDYLRLLARGQIAGQKLIAAEPGQVVGELTVTARVATDTLLRTLGLSKVVRKEGTRAAMRRLDDALAFCRAMGSLVEATSAGGVWAVRLPHPDSQHGDKSQVVLLAEAPSS